jgi:hypothetical protein
MISNGYFDGGALGGSETPEQNQKDRTQSRELVVFEGKDELSTTPAGRAVL